MIVHYIIQSVFVITGSISVMAAIFNWNWFFNAQNSQFVVSYLGRNYSRLFYALVGLLMIGTGIYFYTETSL